MKSCIICVVQFIKSKACTPCLQLPPKSWTVRFPSPELCVPKCIMVFVAWHSFHASAKVCTYCRRLKCITSNSLSPIWVILIAEKPVYHQKMPSPPIKFVKLKIGARRHEANEWLASSKIPQFQCQVFSTADAHIAYWCHNSKSSECRDLHTGLSPMSSASSPDRGRCVPNTSQTVRSLWKRAFPSWSVRFAYTAWAYCIQVRALDTALRSVVEDMKTIL